MLTFKAIKENVSAEIVEKKSKFIANIFYVETSIYDDFTIGQYYTICPNCGYIILLDENILSEEIKLSARRLKEEDPLLYRKNNLKSELIYLESITPKVKARVLW